MPATVPATVHDCNVLELSLHCLVESFKRLGLVGGKLASWRSSASLPPRRLVNSSVQGERAQIMSVHAWYGFICIQILWRVAHASPNSTNPLYHLSPVPNPKPCDPSCQPPPGPPRPTPPTVGNQQSLPVYHGEPMAPWPPSPVPLYPCHYLDTFEQRNGPRVLSAYDLVGDSLEDMSTASRAAGAVAADSGVAPLSEHGSTSTPGATSPASRPRPS
ncbi:unnamed protein product [Discosporangium mesarthrocarpum]